MLFEESFFYFSGKLMLGLDTDWDDLVLRLNMLSQEIRGFRFIPQRAVLDEDGSVYWMEFVGRDSQIARAARRASYMGEPTPGRKPPHDVCDAEKVPLFERELADWLRYPIEISFGSSSITDDRAFQIMKEIRESSLARPMFGPPPQIEKEDILPNKALCDDPLAELDSLIGLDDVKSQVRKIVRMLERSDRDSLPVLHAAFLGNPGTGKTTVARLIASIYDKMGVTDGKGTFVEAAREDLIGIYVGHTAPKTKHVLNTARGGTLFIDEAYSLGMYKEKASVDFGGEAIATLVKDMEDHRNDPIVIMAGYTEPMNQMIDVNPGMRDRIGFYFNFPDYSAEELCAVFEKFAREDGYSLSPAASNYMEGAFENIVANKDSNFANGRIARKVFERVKMNHLFEVGTGCEELSERDFSQAFADEDLSSLMGATSRKATIGFA